MEKTCRTCVYCKQPLFLSYCKYGLNLWQRLFYDGIMLNNDRGVCDKYKIKRKEWEGMNYRQEERAKPLTKR